MMRITEIAKVSVCYDGVTEIHTGVTHVVANLDDEERSCVCLRGYVRIITIRFFAKLRNQG